MCYINELLRVTDANPRLSPLSFALGKSRHRWVCLTPGGGEGGLLASVFPHHWPSGPTVTNRLCIPKLLADFWRAPDPGCPGAACHAPVLPVGGGVLVPIDASGPF